MIQVPGYDMGEPLGSGGVAIVYKVYNRQLHRYEALKVLKPEHLGNVDLKKRFLDGARKLAKVQHRNVLPVYTISEDNAPVPYFTMRYVEGGDLLQLLQKYPYIDRSVILDLLHQISDGIEAAHKTGILHRDLKPANILVENISEDKLQAFVADFDIARSIVRTGHSIVTEHGRPIGTPQYMAPEQIDPKIADPTARTDAYAFACVAWEMLVGQPPFNHSVPEVVMTAHLTTPVPSISAQKSEIPKAADAVFQSALAKNPAQRFSSTGEFVAALERVLLHKRTEFPKIALGAMIAAGLLAVGYGVYETTVPKPQAPVPTQEFITPSNPSQRPTREWTDPPNKPFDPEAGTTGSPYPADPPRPTPDKPREDPPAVSDNFPGGTWTSPEVDGRPKVRLTRLESIPKQVSVGRSFVVDVSGELLQDAGLKLKGSVTVELANSDGTSVADLVSVSSASPNVAMFAPPSEVSIYANGAWSKSALPEGYLIYETNADFWPKSQKRRIRLTITPRKSGRLLVRCRATVNEPKKIPYTVPSADEGSLTVQNLPALEYAVEVAS